MYHLKENGDKPDLILIDTPGIGDTGGMGND